MRRCKTLLLSAAVTAVFCCTSAYAVDLYLFGSYWDKDEADGAGGGGVGIALPLFTEHLLFDVRAYVFEDSDIDEQLESVSMVPLDLGLQFHFLPNGSADPYLLGGLTYLYVDDNEDVLDSNLSGYLGAGVDIPLGTSVFNLFGEALYRFAELDGLGDTTYDVGGFSGNLGVKFHF